MPTLAELASADCPLLRDAPNLKAGELIAVFNQLVRQVQELGAGAHGYLLNRPDIQLVVDDIQRVRERLTRPRYRVGFLGTSQAGKSTTFNNVLQEQIAQGGIGEATTSTITRSRRIPGAPDGPRKFLLRYLTYDQYMERRERLCKAIYILNSVSRSNQEILGYLADPQKLAALQHGEAESELARARKNRTGERGVLPDDIPYLRDFLRSFDAHGQRFVVKDGPPREVEAPFEKRGQYINHGFDPAGVPTENLLLHDAEIGTPNPNIPPQLEAIDCPGLGSKRTVDTVVTKEFLPHLDGALIFIRADQLRSRDVVEILEILKTNFGKLEGRVWIVINKMDGLAKEHFYGDVDGRTTFDLIHLFLADYQIPAEQIVFTSKRLYELAVAAKGKAPLDQVAVLLGVPAQDPIPPKCRSDRVLTSAFQHLLDDGGVSHLRKLILETVAGAVSAQISQAARRELQALQEELTHKIETEQRRVKGGRQQREQAMLCYDTVQELVVDLGTRTEFFRPLADHLKDELFRKFLPNEQQARVLTHMSVDELARRFLLHAKTLEQELDDLLNADVLDRLYSQVAERLEGLPPVPVARVAGGPHEAWQGYRKLDRDPKAWRGQDFPTFQSEELFAGLTGADVYAGFDGEKYIDLMREKIRVAVQQVLHAVRVQLRRRLKEMERELALLVYKPEGNGPRS